MKYMGFVFLFRFKCVEFHWLYTLPNSGLTVAIHCLYLNCFTLTLSHSPTVSPLYGFWVINNTDRNTLRPGEDPGGFHKGNWKRKETWWFGLSHSSSIHPDPCRLLSKCVCTHKNTINYGTKRHCKNCAVLCCAVLCCAVPCRAVPCRAVLCCVVLWCVEMCCVVLKCVVLCCVSQYVLRECPNI